MQTGLWATPRRLAEVSTGETGRELRLRLKAGLIAGLAFAGVMLALQLLTGVPSLPSLLQDRLFSLPPGSITSVLIDRLQFWAKPLALAGIVFGQTVAIALLAAALRWVPHGRTGRLPGDTAALDGLLIGVVLWAVPDLVLLPAAGLGLLGLRAGEGAGPAIATAAAAGLAGAAYAALSTLWSPRQIQAAASPGDPDRAIGRRRLIADGVALAVTAGAGAALLRAIATIGERSAAPSTTAAAASGSAGGASTDSGFQAPAGISAQVTPNERFYVISKNLVDPTLSAAGWSLEIKGLVDNPQHLSYSALLAQPSKDMFATLECVSNTVGGDLMSNARWTGVPLAGLIESAGARRDATWVIFKSADGYVESLPLDLARLPTTLLAHSMNGMPLPSKHGFPLRVVTAGNYGMRNPKWLTSIEVANHPDEGYWERQGWNVESGVRTMARFDTHPQRAAAGSAVPLGGVAFAGDRSVSRVELSTDGGQTWIPASIERPSSPATWVRWAAQWTPDHPGRFILAVRATDGKGAAQIGQRHDPYPSGSTGYHTIQVAVDAAGS
jgi:DMSO/TMAO reductase YedYZ molybdopterin-dependent catalytic subunit